MIKNDLSPAQIAEGIKRIGTDKVAKAAEAQQEIARACAGVRADLAVAAITYNLGQIYHEGFATQGMSKREFMNMVTFAIEAAVDWGPRPSLQEHLEKHVEEPVSNGKGNPNSPWR